MAYRLHKSALLIWHEGSSLRRLFQLSLFIFCLALTYTKSSAAPVNAAGVCPKWSARLLGIDFLKKNVKRLGLKSVEEVICRLPADFLGNYVLAYGGKGAQSGSLQNPRAILFHAVADPRTLRGMKLKFILSFNGHPSQKKYGAIEMMEIRDGRPIHDRVVFDEIDFDAAEGADVSPKPTEGSLSSCTECHGKPSRILFEAYPSWPGFFGSEEFKTVSFEKAAFQEWKKLAASHPRYRYLRLGEKFFENYTTSKEGEKNYFVMNNNRLNDLLLVRHYEQIVGNLRQIPEYDRYKYSYLAAALECSGIEGFLPESLRGNHFGNFSENYFEEALIQIAKEYGFTPDQLREPFMKEIGASPSGLYVMDTHIRQGKGRSIQSKGIGLLRYLVEGRGFSMKGWWMDFDLDKYRMISGRQAAGSSDLALMLIKHDAELQTFGFSIPEKDNNGLGEALKKRIPEYCSALKKRSLEVFSKAPEAPTIGPMRTAYNGSASAVFNRCVGCHSSQGDEAPLIPFEDREGLSGILAKEGLADKLLFRISDEAGEKTMPPRWPMSAAEKEEIRKYLRSLGFR
jgi:hypothetical protein